MYTRGVTLGFSPATIHDGKRQWRAVAQPPARSPVQIAIAVEAARTARHAVLSIGGAQTGHHPAGSPGSQCVACHMPKIQPELPGGPFVAAHNFHFITPVATETMNIPNACNACHADKDHANGRAAIRAGVTKFCPLQRDESMTAAFLSRDPERGQSIRHKYCFAVRHRERPMLHHDQPFSADLAIGVGHAHQLFVA